MLDVSPNQAPKLQKPVANSIKKGEETFLRARKEIAAKYIRGEGIEIGALHSPLPLPKRAIVRYVDRMSVTDLRRQYPELNALPLIEVDILDDGESIKSIAAASVDFVVASHLIEHIQDPIGALQNWLRVIKPNGILYLGVPHKEHTFDKDRSATKLEHLIRDHEEGPAWSRLGHFEEWVRLVDHTPEERVEAEVKRILAMDYSIHYHVWTELEFLELLMYCRSKLNMPFRVECLRHNEFEIIFILRKLPALAGKPPIVPEIRKFIAGIPVAGPVLRAIYRTLKRS